MDIGHFVQDLILVLIAGTVSAIVCRRLAVSLIAGYLIVGAVIGRGGLGLISDPEHELELLAEGGALLLLFSVGIEFSLDELVKLRRFFFVGGFVQMTLVAVPLTVLARWFGLGMPAAVLAGTAGAFSSTVLVFRALAEAGQAESSHGRRAIAVLLFQDAALVPLLLLVPLLTGDGALPTWTGYSLLALKTVCFLIAVLLLHRFVSAYGAEWLARARSTEIVVLVTTTLLCGLCWAAHALELPPAVGAFAAGLVLSGNRLSRQMDAIVLPFRETFAAVFFVTLGMLLDPRAVLAEPLLLTSGILGMVLLKTAASAVALRAVGLPWRAAVGMGLGLSQLGEFSFLLVSRGVSAGVISHEVYNRMLFIAVVTLIATPILLRQGLKLAQQAGEHQEDLQPAAARSTSRVLVIGIGLIGGRVASYMETKGFDITLIDLSPVNLHGFAQAGFPTRAGDARDPALLKLVDVTSCELVVLCVPHDEAAVEIVKSIRQLTKKVPILVRCRYHAMTPRLERAGATAVVSEEHETVAPVLRQCELLIGVDGPPRSAK